MALPLLVVPPVAVLATISGTDLAETWSAPARAWTATDSPAADLRLLLFCSLIPFAFLLLVRAAPSAQPTWGLPAGTWLASYAAALVWEDLMGRPDLYSQRGRPVLLGVPILALFGLLWAEGQARELVRPLWRAVLLGPGTPRSRRVPTRVWAVCGAGALLMGALVLPFHLIVRQRVGLAFGRPEAAAYLLSEAPSLAEAGLLRLLSSSDPEDRRCALQVLQSSYHYGNRAQAHDEPYFSRVLELLRADPDRYVRANAVLGLLDYPEPAARTAAAAALDDPEPLVRALARVSRLLEHEEPATQEAVDALVAVADPGEREAVLATLYWEIATRRRPSPEPTEAVVVLLAATALGAQARLAEWTHGLAGMGSLPAPACDHPLLRQTLDALPAEQVPPELVPGG